MSSSLVGSGRSSRPTIGSLSQRIQDESDQKTKRWLVLQQLHDAAQIGDVDTVQTILDTHKEIHINTARKGRNTTLHTAVLHNQYGLILDYLIANGADVNVTNTRGHSPLILSVMHCKGSRAVEKLIAGGAIGWESPDMSELAKKFKNDQVIDYLQTLTLTNNGGICKEVSSSNNSPVKLKLGRAICPICNVQVKFPTKMSRLQSDQAAIEKVVTVNGEYRGGKHKHRKYISRKYMDQLLAHSNGEAYKKLCQIQYHQVENMRLRKEISESYAILHAVQECCIDLGVASSSEACKENICLENVFLIDLCSGKGITTALCGALDGGKDNISVSNNYFLAVDRLLPHSLPHFLHDEQIQYLCRDVMSDELYTELEEIVQYQTKEQGRACILVGMHLCGLLSERAIEFFRQIKGIEGIVLSPCCLPKRHEQRVMTSFSKEKAGENDDAELFNYFRWADYLKEKVEGVVVSDDDVRMYSDEEMHSEKNSIIVGVRK